jgi:uncharacterized protein YgiB involved in biofilm formation
MGKMNFVIWGVAALALIVYWAWPEKQEEALAYQSAEACIKAGENEPDVCRAEFEKAKSLHENSVPRYRSQNQCQGDFGYNRCYRTGSIWLPFMAGYLLAPRGRSSIFSQPLYRTASAPNSFRTASGGRIGAVSVSGGTKISKSEAGRPAARTRTVSRGGFGMRAAGRSAGG